MKDLLKGLKGIVEDVIEEMGTEDMPAQVKHAATSILFKKYEKKLHEPYLASKLNDEQHEKAEEKTDKAEEKETPKFKVGQRVQFKTWDEMEKEFGIGFCGSIKCTHLFVEDMKPLCGTYATITEIKGKTIELDEFSSSADHLWNFSVDMVKAVEQ